MLETGGPGEASGLVQRGLERGAARVVVIGGDGTVHEVANGMLTSGVEPLPALGVVPVGTGNDFARLTGTLGLSPEAAMSRLAHARIGHFDVGHAWGEYFVNSVGIGFDAEVADRVNRMIGARGMLAYLSATLGAYRAFRPPTLTVTAGEALIREPIMLVEVSIGATVGGGFRLTPEARPDDGLFDVCVIRALGGFEFVTRLPLAMMGRHAGLAQVRMFRLPALTVRADAQPLAAQFDGEVRRRDQPLDFRLEPGRLPVLLA